jgi:hypothetical protein
MQLALRGLVVLPLGNTYSCLKIITNETQKEGGAVFHMPGTA